MKRRTNQRKWRGNKDNGKLTLGEWEGKTNKGLTKENKWERTENWVKENGKKIKRRIDPGKKKEK